MYNIKKELEKFNEILDSMDSQDASNQSNTDADASSSASAKVNAESASEKTDASPAPAPPDAEPVARPATPVAARADRPSRPSHRVAESDVPGAGAPYGVYNGGQGASSPKRVIETKQSPPAENATKPEVNAKELFPRTPGKSANAQTGLPSGRAVPNRGVTPNRGVLSTEDPPMAPHAPETRKQRPVVPIPPNPVVPARSIASSTNDDNSLRKVRLPEGRGPSAAKPPDKHRDLDALIDDLRGSLNKPAVPLRETNPIAMARTVDKTYRPSATVEPIGPSKRRPALTLVAATVALVVPAVLASVLLFGDAGSNDGAEFASNATISSSDQPTLTVTTEPRGASVFLNNQLVGVTPFEGVKVAPGDYVMTTELDGFVQSDTIISIRGTASLALALNAVDAGALGDGSGHILAGLENVEPAASDPAPARDGSGSSFDTPVVAAGGLTEDRTPGRTEDSGVSQSTREVAGTRTEADRTPPALVGVMSVTSDPPGATVWLDGEAVGETPVTLRDIPSGNHQLRMTRPNHETFETDITVAAGIVTPFHGRLAPVVGTIVLEVSPEGSVYINDELVNERVSGTARFDVAPGSHTVRVVNESYGSREIPVEVRPTRSAELRVDFVTEDLERLLEEADALFDNAEFHEARDVYQRAAAIAPGNSRIAGKIAEVDRLIEAQREQEAVEAIIEDGVYLVVDKPPQLIGGLEALHKTVVYPEAAYKAGVEGRVFVQFVVDEEGNPSDVKISKGLPLGCNESAMDAVRKAKFIPGEFRGRKVKVRHTLFINFRK